MGLVPDPTSDYCDGQCFPNKWRIKVLQGKYRVKIIVGHHSNEYSYSLQINGTKIMDGEIIQSMVFQTKLAEVRDLSGYISITNKCTNNCKNE